jgi:hypothetical protein
MPELLAARVPKLTDQRRTLGVNIPRDRLKRSVVRVIKPGYGGRLSNSLGINGDNLGDQHAGPALGPLNQKISPGLGDTVVTGKISHRSAKANAIAQAPSGDLYF